MTNENPNMPVSFNTDPLQVNREKESLSPARLAWKRFRQNRVALFGLILISFLYGIVLCGSFFAMNDPVDTDLSVVHYPPTLPRFVDENGKFHLRPFVYGMKMSDKLRHRYDFVAAEKYPLQFFVKGHPYKLWWLIETDRHFIGVQEGGKFYPLGTDGVGRCVFSRLMEGAKISLSIGILAISVSLVIGLFMGGIAGYYGDVVDNIIMRLVEFMLSIPTLYLIIALRAYFQTEGVFGIGGGDITSTEMFLIIVVILSLIGWAGQARVIRGMVLSIKEQDFIMAEKALGASTLRILTFHILPNTMSYVIVSASIAIPGFILGEVALSFLGVGIQEPQISWGIMLDQARSVSEIRNFPWILLGPAVAIFVTVVAFNFVGDGLRDALDPKHNR